MVAIQLAPRIAAPLCMLVHPCVCCAAVPGSTLLRASALPFAAGTYPATGTSTSVFVLPGRPAVSRACFLVLDLFTSWGGSREGLAPPWFPPEMVDETGMARWCALQLVHARRVLRSRGCINSSDSSPTVPFPTPSCHARLWAEQLAAGLQCLTKDRIISSAISARIAISSNSARAPAASPCRAE